MFAIVFSWDSHNFLIISRTTQLNQYIKVIPFVKYAFCVHTFGGNQLKHACCITVKLYVTLIVLGNITGFRKNFTEKV